MKSNDRQHNYVSTITLYDCTGTDHYQICSNLAIFYYCTTMSATLSIITIINVELSKLQ